MYPKTQSLPLYSSLSNINSWVILSSLMGLSIVYKQMTPSPDSTLNTTPLIISIYMLKGILNLICLKLHSWLSLLHLAISFIKKKKKLNKFPCSLPCHSISSSGPPAFWILGFKPYILPWLLSFSHTLYVIHQPISPVLASKRFHTSHHPYIYRHDLSYRHLSE